VGGAAMAIIVKDPNPINKDPNPIHPIHQTNNNDNDNGNDNNNNDDALALASALALLPMEVRTATERILVFQDWDIPEAVQVARISGDKLLQESFSNIKGGESIGQRFVTVNGKYQPIGTIPVGTWERWRILYAGWQDLPLNFGIITTSTPTSSNADDTDDDDGNDGNGNGADCEFYLLAKDGIYISDYPRGPMMSTDDGNTFKLMPIPPGGRADFMVRCHNVGGTTRFEALGRRNTLTLNCGEDDDDDDDDVGDDEDDEDDYDEEESDLIIAGDANSTMSSFVDPESADEEEDVVLDAAAFVQRSVSPLTPWSSASSRSDLLPDYLQPVDRSTSTSTNTNTVVVTPGCSCETEFSGYDDTGTVNGEIYRPGNRFLHTSFLGAVVERKLKGMNEHSYHQHVYPFQLIDFPVHNNNNNNNNNDYFKIGDWHDTYLDQNQKGGGGPVTIRYRTTDIPGKIM